MTMENEVQKEEVEVVEEQTDASNTEETPGETSVAEGNPGEAGAAEDNPGDNPGGGITLAVLGLTTLALGSVGAYFMKKKGQAAQAQVEAQARAAREAKLRQFREATDTGDTGSGEGLV